MYLVGFAVGYVILRRLSRQGRLPIPGERVGELVGLVALGVIVGGRLGYILFYNPSIFLRPLEILMLWEGGLSFHGGVIGVVIAFWWFGRRTGVPFLAMADGIVLAAPPGIAGVRMANFINGELYGRIAGEGVPWAMRFPTDPVALRLLGAESGRPEAVYRAVKAARDGGTWEQIEAQIPLRHPSQLYEAALEGVLLFLGLWAVVLLARRFGWKVRKGMIGGLFLVGYSVSRIFVENFRQPDMQFTGPGDPLGTVLGPLTMGQVLSLGLLAAGIFVIVLVALGKGPEGLSHTVQTSEEPS
jgi:phosphatidylglycerol:prolipoprotein diacylglycerol transferase